MVCYRCCVSESVCDMMVMVMVMAMDAVGGHGVFACEKKADIVRVTVHSWMGIGGDCGQYNVNLEQADHRIAGTGVVICCSKNKNN